MALPLSTHAPRWPRPRDISPKHEVELVAAVVFYNIDVMVQIAGHQIGHYLNVRASFHDQ